MHMRPYTRNFILTAVSVLAILLLRPPLQANSIIVLNGGYPYAPIGSDLAGPYSLTITTPGSPTQVLLAFCLDANKNFQQNSTGDLTPFSTLAEGQLPPNQWEEVAFLASYAVLTDPQHTNFNTVGGPTSLAIWSIMNTLGGTNLTVNSDAQAYITSAETAVANPGTSALMSGFLVWTPTGWTPTNNASQRFIVFAATPEPGTVLFLGTGVLLMALSRIRRRR